MKVGGSNSTGAWFEGVWREWVVPESPGAKTTSATGWSHRRTQTSPDHAPDGQAHSSPMSIDDARLTTTSPTKVRRKFWLNGRWVYLDEAGVGAGAGVGVGGANNGTIGITVNGTRVEANSTGFLYNGRWINFVTENVKNDGDPVTSGMSGGQWSVSGQLLRSTTANFKGMLT